MALGVIQARRARHRTGPCTPLPRTHARPPPQHKRIIKYCVYHRHRLQGLPKLLSTQGSCHRHGPVDGTLVTVRNTDYNLHSSLGRKAFKLNWLLVQPSAGSRYPSSDCPDSITSHASYINPADKTIHPILGYFTPWAPIPSSFGRQDCPILKPPHVDYGAPSSTAAPQQRSTSSGTVHGAMQPGNRSHDTTAVEHTYPPTARHHVCDTHRLQKPRHRTGIALGSSRPV